MDKLNLSEKVVVITGVSSGLGKELLRVFLENKTKVAGIVRREESLAILSEESRGYKIKPLLLHGDISNPGKIKNMVEKVVDYFGGINILINNSAINFPSPAMKYTIHEWKETLNVNLTAPFLLARESYEYMKKRGGGLIINITSVEGILPTNNPPSIAYSVSKAGLIQLTRALAIEWGKDNIRVIAVAPGPFPSLMTEEFFNDEQFSQLKENWLKKIPLGRTTTTYEIAQSIVALATPAFSYATGTVFVLDGGLTAGL